MSFNMVVSLVKLLLVLTAFVGISQADENVDLGVNIKVANSIQDYHIAHIGFNFIPVQKSANNDPRHTMKYSIGRRVDGDAIVAQTSNSHKFPTLQDVDLNITYPKEGSGAIVSYVEIVVNQSSKLGNGYVIHGGIGQRHIGILVQAKSTLHFDYTAIIYGY